MVDSPYGPARQRLPRILFVLFIFCMGAALLLYSLTEAAPTASVSHHGIALPDLIIEQIQVTPPNPESGTIGDIEVTVKNIGDAPVTNFGVHLYVDAEGDPPTIDTLETTRTFYGVDPIPSGGIFTFARTDHTFTQAAPVIYAWVDRDNDVAESNESNNLYPSPPVQMPDIYEQDDSCNTAKPIGVNDPPQQRNLFQEDQQPDQDWVTLEVNAGVVYEISAIAVGEDADVIIGSRSRCDMPTFNGGGQTIEITATTDTTYFLNIEHVRAEYGPDSAYELIVRTDELCTRFEPNNRCELAQPIYSNEDTPSATFCVATDVDWYTFEVRAGIAYTVTASNLGPNANVEMRLFEACDGTPAQNGLIIPYTAAQREYLYLEIKNQDPQQAGLDTEYSIQVQGEEEVGCHEDTYEVGSDQDAAQDDDIAHAQPIPVDGAPQVRNFCPAGDVDWVKFTADDGANYLVETFNLGSHADTKLCLHNADNQESICNDDDGAGLGSRLLIENAEAGEHFLSVTDNNPRVAGPKTYYALQVVTESCQPDEFEPDNSAAAAHQIDPSGAKHQHTICAAQDEDWMKFELAAQTPYVIETVDVGPEADTIIDLYDAAGNLLQSNDDYSDGVASQIGFTPTVTAQYFARIRLFNPTHYGEGADYTFRAYAGTNIYMPPPEIDPPDESSETHPAGSVDTLILINPTRLAELYDDESVQSLLATLEQLAQHEQVQGKIIKLDDQPLLQNAYDRWLEEPTSVGRANAVADAIRLLIRRHVAQQAGLEYVLLIGDDRVLPFYRILDEVTLDPEIEYSDEVTKTHPTGAAIHQNYYLTDDIYGAPRSGTGGTTDYFVPTLAVGRLLETPDDIKNFIDHFLQKPEPEIDHILVSGWDFVTDLSQELCRRWRIALGDNSQTRVNCALQGGTWTQGPFREARLQSNPVHTIQSINGHAAHFGDQAPDKALVTAEQIDAAPVNFGGGLIYSPGCHGGLNVPPENAGKSDGLLNQFIPLDLPEVFLRKNANYVGNSGNGYGSDGGIVLSEELMTLFTLELASQSYGKALMRAKQRYASILGQTPDPYEEKVLQELIFYGLPMMKPNWEADTQAHAASAISEEDPFPGVIFELSPLSLDPNLTTRSAKVNFQNGDVELVETANGDYIKLSGQAQGTPGQPLSPLFFRDLERANEVPRSVVMRHVTYTVTADFDPLVMTPTNEHFEDEGELRLDTNAGWSPASPFRLQTISNTTTLVMQVAQHHGMTQRLRQFEALQADVLYSNSTDRRPPSLVVVDGLYDSSTGLVTVKVGATDQAGIHAVTLAYVQDERSNAGTIRTIDLKFEPASRKWTGSFEGTANSLFFAQIIDRNGNMLEANNKGHWFGPAIAGRIEGDTLFLPLVAR